MSHQTASGGDILSARNEPQDSAPPEAALKPAAAPSQSYYIKDYAVLASSLSGPIIASGKALGPGLSKIQARVAIFRSPHHNSWLGFSLNFPLGEKQQDNEESGFGVRYGCKSDRHFRSPLHHTILTETLRDRRAFIPEARAARAASDQYQVPSRWLCLLPRKSRRPGS